jgi:dUTP pyrophosphatase
MEKNRIEEYIKRLKELDGQLSNDPDPTDLMVEINSILNGLSQDIQLDTTKKTLSATLTFVNTSQNPDPSFTHKGDIGFDLRANLKKDVIISEGKVCLIPTGLYFEVNKGLEVQIRPAVNNNVMVLNSPSTGDSSCRGEIKIILVNFGDTPIVVRNGERIAQGVVCPVYGEGNLNLVKVDKLSKTVRDNNGFGSTGTK